MSGFLLYLKRMIFVDNTTGSTDLKRAYVRWTGIKILLNSVYMSMRACGVFFILQTKDLTYQSTDTEKQFGAQLI